jgi:hypothetical protein
MQIPITGVLETQITQKKEKKKEMGNGKQKNSRRREKRWERTAVKGVNR